MAQGIRTRRYRPTARVSEAIAGELEKIAAARACYGPDYRPLVTYLDDAGKVPLLPVPANLAHLLRAETGTGMARNALHISLPAAKRFPKSHLLMHELANDLVRVGALREAHDTAWHAWGLLRQTEDYQFWMTRSEQRLASTRFRYILMTIADREIARGKMFPAPPQTEMPEIYTGLRIPMRPHKSYMKMVGDRVKALAARQAA